MAFRILSLHPHTTSTKAALFEDNVEIKRGEIQHDPQELADIPDISAQCTYRLRALEGLIAGWTMPDDVHIDAVIGMAYMSAQMPVGVYIVDSEFMRRAWKTRRDRKKHDLGALLAVSLAKPLRSTAYALITLSSDEFDYVARMSGIPGLHFGKMTHALYIKNAVRVASRDLEKSFSETSLIIAHLDRSFSICAHSDGRIRDMTITFERGPFSQARSGGIPSADIVRMAYSGVWSKNDLIERLHNSGGLISYMGTDNLSEALDLASAGNEYASLIVRSMTYQLASEIAAMAATLHGAVDAIVLEGGCTSDERFVEMLRERVSWITDRILVYPGDDELSSISNAALNVLNGEMLAFKYAYITIK
ncbi:MAG: butyrate kinase [Synergistaceae bacterium]|jgi:butyrate kinase|nr:butyrate kinase [Synergistaceae bacterium]